MLNHKPLILITGATCSGKSSLAVNIAKNLNAEVVSIDSVQVYKDFNIGSAKITNIEMQGVKHHLLDIWEPTLSFNVAKYLKLADEVIESIYKSGKNVVIAGGTTMYVTSLIHGLAPIEKSNSELRARLDKRDTNKLYNLLKRLDPLSATVINKNDRTRIVRALEVKIISKQSIKNIQETHKFSGYKYDCLAYVLCQKREDLYSKINLRTSEMVKNGLIEEVQSLIKIYNRGLSPFSSIGYKQALQYLDGQCSIDEMIEDISKCTRHLAKRQMTYLRNEPIKRGWKVFPKNGESDSILLSSDNSTVVGKGVIKDFFVYNYDFNELIKNINIDMKNGIEGVKLSYISSRCLTC